MESETDTLASDSQGATEPGSDPDVTARRGAVFGRYVLLGKLGQGGMGVVFAAYDPELDRKVAIKLLHLQSSVGMDETEARNALSRALENSGARAMSVFMTLARQRADQMLETLGSSPENLGVSSVVESNLRDLNEILMVQSRSLVDEESKQDESSVTAILDLFLHPLLRFALRSAKVSFN